MREWWMSTSLRRMRKAPVPADAPLPLTRPRKGQLKTKRTHPRVYSSVWHTPVATMRTRTSPARGGATSTVSTTRGVLGAQATAARQVMGFPAVGAAAGCPGADAVMSP